MSNPTEPLIFDRIEQDVLDDLPKGQYKASDLNRVETWCRYLADELNTAGYTINITTKTDWTQTDMRTVSEMERIRLNIRSIMVGYHFITRIYSTSDNFDYIKANNWEQILDEIFHLLWGMTDWYVYSGVANAGQNRLWQNRFRHYYTSPIVVIEYLTTETGDTLTTENGEELEVDTNE